jgi:hypothetical protein
LHSQQPPIIFRDLKPGNIMLTRTGRIKLIDFGIARIFRASGAQDTQLLGTPGFAPPEQYGSSQTDERSDVYSLAMTLFQLMTDAVDEHGFGLKDVHFSYPHISPPVARVLEKATSLKSEDRYESIVVFRRALLGIGTFRFENGGEATTPDELADLCAHYPAEAADYLFAGEIESWLQEIGEGELARAVRRIHATVGDPDMAVEKLLQVLKPGLHVRGSSTGVQAAVNGQNGVRTQETGTISRTGRVLPPVIVDPKTIDFGQVYPGLSAPILLTLSGARGALISGTIRPIESWIVLDQTTFDGTRIPITVRVESTRLRGATHYTGTIMIAPDDSEREIAVTIEVDVLGYTTTTIARKQGGTQASAATALPDDDVVLPGTGKMRMAPQATVTVDQPIDSRRTNEYKAKYGPPGGGGWDPFHDASPRQSMWRKRAISFTAAFITAGFFYLVLSHLPPLVHVSFLPPSPWFTVVLLGMIPFATLGIVIVNWLTAWNSREALNRICTSLSTGLVFLGLGETAWQSLVGQAAPALHLFVLLLGTSLAATIGSIPAVSDKMIKSATWGMLHMRWLVIALAMLLGGTLGFALTNGLASGFFTPFGILLGIGVGALLALRVDHLMKQKPHP